MKPRLGITIVLHLKVIKLEMCHRSREWLATTGPLSMPFKGLWLGPSTYLGSDLDMSPAAWSWAKHFNPFEALVSSITEWTPQCQLLRIVKNNLR